MGRSEHMGVQGVHEHVPVVYVPAQRTSSHQRKSLRVATAAATGLALLAIGCAALTWTSGPPSRSVELDDAGGKDATATMEQGRVYDIQVQDDHAEPSVEDIYNPSSDPDSPSPSLSQDPSAGRMKLQEGLQKVLQQAESTNALAASNRVTHPHVVTKPSNLFDPALDPDAPTDKFVKFMTNEQRDLEGETKMKKRLKLEAKVAMLTSRETQSLVALKPKTAADAKAKEEERAQDKDKPKDKGTWPKRRAEHDWMKGPPTRPGLKELTAMVQAELNKGDDPNALLKKEKMAEEKYERESKAYAKWKADGEDDDRR